MGHKTRTPKRNIISLSPARQQRPAEPAFALWAD